MATSVWLSVLPIPPNGVNGLSALKKNINPDKYGYDINNNISVNFNINYNVETYKNNVQYLYVMPSSFTFEKNDVIKIDKKISVFNDITKFNYGTDTKIDDYNTISNDIYSFKIPMSNKIPRNNVLFKITILRKKKEIGKSYNFILICKSSENIVDGPFSIAGINYNSSKKPYLISLGNIYNILLNSTNTKQTLYYNIVKPLTTQCYLTIYTLNKGYIPIEQKFKLRINNIIEIDFPNNKNFYFKIPNINLKINKGINVVKIELIYVSEATYLSTVQYYFNFGEYIPTSPPPNPIVPNDIISYLNNKTNLPIQLINNSS